MLYETEVEAARPAKGLRPRKALMRALQAVSAVTVVAGGLAACYEATTSASTGAAVVSVLPQRARQALQQGALGIGAVSSSKTGRIERPATGCRGPRGFGQPFVSADWPGGFHGVPIYSNGISGSFTDCLHRTRTPGGRVVVDGYEWQCVELVDRLYLAKGWIGSAWLGNGNQLFATAPRGLARQRQGHITYAHPGDVISFDGPPGNGFGHAAVIGRVQGLYLTILNQNTDRASVISHAYLIGGRIVMVGWPGWRPIGVVHAPVR